MRFIPSSGATAIGGFFSKKTKLLAVLAGLWATGQLHGQELDLAFLDKMPKGEPGSVPVFYFEKGKIVGQVVWENAPTLAPRGLGVAMMPPCSPCPTIAAVFINGCYNPAGIDPDEFLLINSGGGFTLGDLQIDFQSNGGSTANNDIGFIFTAGFGTNVGTTPCGLVAGDLSKVTGCANFIAATASTVIPANSLVVLQSTATNSGTTVFNYSSICGGHEKCVYVAKNACTRTSGSFSNSASRTTGIAINGCSCLSYNTYPNPSGTDGDYYLTSGLSGTSTPCATAPPVPHTNFTTIPVFNQPPSPLCAISPYTLPAITGTNLTGNQKYYTGPGGTGTAYSAGASFAFSGPTTLYLYDVTVGCVVEKTLQLVPAVVANAGADAAICPGGSVQLSASGGATYAWSPGAGLSATNIPNPMASPVATTTYTVTVTAATGGCTATDQVVVTVGTNPVPTITPTPGTVIDCNNTTLTLTAGGGASYLWSTGAGGGSISVSAAGTFTVTATSATGGCTAVASQIITQNNTPPVAAIVNNTGTTELSCTITQINLTATGGGTYLWSNGLGTSASVSILAPGTYSVTVTAANGCTASASIVITQNAALPVVNISTNPATTVLTCATGSIVLTASSTPPGATFSWTTPSGSASGANVTASLPGNYIVTATAAGGCTAVGNVVISQNLTLPNATVSPATGTITCNTPTINLLAGSTTPGATFNWGGGNFSQTNTVAAAGNFTVTVTNPANGCTATATSVISQNTAMPGATIAPATVVLTCTDPTANLTASSGDPAAMFNWGNGNLTNTQIATAAGTFSVTATGANGCTSGASAIVSENLGLPTISILPATPELNCTVSQITLTASSNATGGTFVWNTGATGPTLNVTTSGNFSVTVTAANGCSNTTSVLVNQNLDQPNAAVNPTAVSLDCTMATAVLTASSTTTGATFNWGGGNFSTTKTVAAAGNFTVTVTAPNGCTASASASVTADFAQPDATVTPVSGEINCGNPTITLTASSQTGGATFDWGGGNFSTTKTVAAAGNFTVTVTDPANGCTATASSLISQNNAAPNGSILPASPVLTCADPTVMLIVSSTTMGATFEWPNGATGDSFFVNAPGTYSVTVTGPNGCTIVISKTVTQAPDISGVQILTTQTTCGSATGSIALTPAGGAPFTYDWGGQPGSGSNPRTGLPIGSFTCTVTNDFGCTAEATASITAPNAPAVVVETFPDTCGQMMGIGWLHITGGATPYNIDWGTAPGSGDTLRTGMVAGNFTVTITDGNGCTAVASVSISQLLPPEVQATTAPDFCGQSNGAVFLTVTGDQSPFTIDWGGQPGNGSNPRTDLPAGSYDVTVTDAVDCSQTITMVVSAMVILPTAAISPQNAQIDCQNPSVTLVATSNEPNAAFLWNDNSVENSLVVTVPGPYSVTVTAANGCSNSATATVGGSSDLPDLTILPASATLNCTNPTAVLTASSTATGATFNWGNGNTGPTLSVSSAGNFGVTVTAPNGCTAAGSAVVSQDFAQPSLAVSPVLGEINCANPSVTLTADAPDAVSFLWNNTLITPTISTTTGGVFSVTVTAANGCTNAGGATVSEDNAAPDLMLSPLLGEITCAVSSLNLTAFSAAPNAVFTWTGGTTGPVLTVTTGGIYSVTVTGQNACTATATANVLQNNTPPALTLTTPSNNLTCQFPTVTLTAGSVAGATFLWQNGSTASTFDVVAPGIFSVTATAASSGCTAAANIMIGQILGISAVSATATDPPCGTTNGSISLNITGGTAPFSINWGNAPGSGDNPRTGLPPGNYSATVTDANGCTETATASVSAAVPPAIGMVATASACSVANGTISLTIVGGTSPFSIDWGGQPGTGLNPRENLPPGSYSVTVTDAASCTVIASAQVGQSPVPMVSAVAAAATCGQDNGSILLNITGGTQPFSINWGSQPGLGDSPRTGLPGGNFTATVTDVNGCAASATASVASPGAPQLVFSNKIDAKCGLPNGSVTLGISGGTTPYNINWGSAPGSGTNTRTGLPAGNFPVTVTDAAGCQLFLSFEILDSPPLDDIQTLPTNASCGGQNGSIEVVATGGTSPLSYDWTGQPGGGGKIRTGLPIGVFTVTVTDAAGCTKIGPPTQIGADPFVTGGTFTTTMTTCGLADGTAFVTPISGVDVFQFQWGSQPGSGSNPRTKLPVGTFTVTILDGNGCTAAASVNILSAPGQVVSTTLTNADCGLENRAIALQISGGKQPYSLDWGGQPGTGTNPRTSLPPGLFIVTVTDGNGCSVLQAGEILADSFQLASQVLPTTCNLPNGQINIQVSGGTPGTFVFEWGSQPGNGSNPRFDLPAGDFTVTVTNGSACSAIISGAVLASAAGPTASAIATATACGANTGAIILTTTGGTGTLDFDWGSQPGIGQNPRTGLPAGSFSVTISDDSGCSTTASATVNAPGAPMVLAAPVAASCGGANGSASLQISGGTAPFSIDWGTAPGIGQNPRTGLPAGNFIVTVTGGNGCSASVSVGILGSPAILATATAVSTTCGAANGEIFIQLNNAVGSSVFNWGSTPGLGSNPRVGLPGGQFFVEITDGAGCTATASATVGSSTAIVVDPLALPTGCGQSSGEISFTASGGDASGLGYSVGWGSAPGSGSNPRTGLPMGNYFFTVSDSDGCSAVSQAQIDVADAPVILILDEKPADCGQTNGAATISAMGGTDPIMLDWGSTPGAGSTVRTGLPAGIFTVSATDAAGCTGTATVVIPGTTAATTHLLAKTCDPAKEGVDTVLLQTVNMCDSLVITTTILQPGAVQFLAATTCEAAAAGMDTVFLKNQFGCDSLVITTTVLKSTPPQFFNKKSCNPAAVGVDTVFLKNQFGCDSLLVTTTVFDPNAADSTLLFEKTCDPAAVGFTQILLKNTAGCDSLVITSTVLSPSAILFFNKKSCNPAAVGVDTVFLQNQFGCDSLLVTTTVFDQNAADSTLLFEKTCDPAAVGTAQILLKNTAGCDSLVITSTVLSPSAILFFNKKSCNPAAVGVDTVFLQNQFGCDSLLVTVTVFDQNAIDSTLISQKTCDPAAVGFTQILLKNTAGCDSLVITSTVLSPSAILFFNKKSCNPAAVGVDTVFLQNQFGCDSLLVTVTVFDQNAIDSTLISQKTCDPAAVGFTQILLKNTAGCDSLVITSTVLSPSAILFFNKKSCNPAAVGVDTVFLQNQFGCDSLLVTVTVFDQNAIDSTLLFEKTCDAAAVGFTQILLKNTAGCDSIVITTTVLDLVGCAVDFTAFLDPAKCHDEASGAIRIKPSQGLLPMTYDWLHIQSGATGSGLITDLTIYTSITGLIPGAYLVTVTTATGATAAKAFGVPNVPAISLTINVLSDFNGFAVRCAGVADGRAEAVFQDAKPPVIYQWSGGATAQSVDNLPAGPLTLTLIDANGCTASATSLLDAPPPILTQILLKNVGCAGSPDGEISLGPVAGGVAPYLFSFENGVFGAENQFSGLAEGDYFMEIEDANGCRDSMTAAILPGNGLVFELPIDSATIFSGDTLWLPLANPGASIVWNPPFQVWQNGPSEVVFAPLTSLFYKATITDSAGCTASDGLFIWVKNGRDFFAPTALRPGAQLSPNDFFTIFTGEGVAEIEVLQVFDRWGELVFSNKNFQPNQPELGWDGRFNGNLVQPVVYVWRANLRLTDGRIVEMKGDLTVVR